MQAAFVPAADGFDALLARSRNDACRHDGLFHCRQRPAAEPERRHNALLVRRAAVFFQHRHLRLGPRHLLFPQPRQADRRCVSPGQRAHVRSCERRSERPERTVVQRRGHRARRRGLSARRPADAVFRARLQLHAHLLWLPCAHQERLGRAVGRKVHRCGRGSHGAALQ